MKSISRIIVGVLLSLSLCSCGAPQKLSDEDSMAFEYLEAASSSFKDPSSVRIVSGAFSGDDEPTLYAKVLATNSFGANVTSYYAIFDDGTCIEWKPEVLEYAIENPDYDTLGDLVDELPLFFADDALDYDAINQKLGEKWGLEE